MERILELFKQLQALLNEKPDLKTCQELHVLSEQLAAGIDYCRMSELRELRDTVDFLSDASTAVPFSFGQCGDKVYWKIVDDVLYIGGTGPMWDFDNSTPDYHKSGLFSPWKGANYHTVVILNGVTTVGADAFNGAEISSVIIPKSVKAIGEIAFFDAKIEKLILPDTIDRIEQGILNGFSRVVDTLVVSVNISSISPYAFFNRDDVLAKEVFLIGNLPEDMTPIVESCLFDGAGRYKIYYPENWDKEGESFFEKLSPNFDDSNGNFTETLKNALIPYAV